MGQSLCRAGGGTGRDKGLVKVDMRLTVQKMALRLGVAVAPHFLC